MNREEAIRTITSYHAGGAVPAQTLRAALAVLRTAAAESDPLAPPAGVHEAVTDCEILLDHLAELAALEQGTRQRRYPDLLEHLRRCLSCRQAFWDTRRTCWSGAATLDVSGPMGVTVVAAPLDGGHARTRRRLEEGLIVEFPRRGGAARDGGLSPPATLQFPVAKSAGTRPEPDLHWDLTDDDSGIHILLDLHRTGPDEATLTIGLTGADIRAEDVRIRVTSAAVEFPIQEGSLRLCATTCLTPGAHLVECWVEKVSRMWSIPISVAPVDDDGEDPEEVED